MLHLPHPLGMLIGTALSSENAEVCTLTYLAVRVGRVLSRMHQLGVVDVEGEDAQRQTSTVG